MRRVAAHATIITSKVLDFVRVSTRVVGSIEEVRFIEGVHVDRGDFTFFPGVACLKLLECEMATFHRELLSHITVVVRHLSCLLVEPRTTLAAFRVVEGHVGHFRCAMWFESHVCDRDPINSVFPINGVV